MKVSWDESVCIHAGKCVQGAPEVFKIEDGKFVIDTSAAAEDKIADVVSECPSGALKMNVLNILLGGNMIGDKLHGDAIIW